VTRLLRRIAELRALVAGWKRADETVALVPTMGALHDGHLSLVERAKAEGERVIVTIFVNPTQFNDPDDLAKYPRSEETDLACLAPFGVDTVFAPPVGEVYPGDHATTVSVRDVSATLEGEHRPGHFDGVATVVAKLFGMTQADVACFGEKDWQQLQVVRRMAADLDMPVRIVGCPTVREPDGLARSSRNARLSRDDRARAAALPRAMAEAAAGMALAADPETVLGAARAALRSAGFESIDYLAVRDAATLGEPSPGRPARLLAAASIGGVRLIDNIPCPWPAA
jgi:pantoate--beta-alanine ligase